MTASTSHRVSIHSGWLWLFRLGCPALGFALGFAVEPLVRWLTTNLDSAPAPLRLAAEIPEYWLVPALTVIGVFVGLWIAMEAERDSLTVTVGAEGLRTAHGHDERYLRRERVAAVFTDPKDLVVLDGDGREVFRAKADLPTDALAVALRRHDYPWHGTADPHEAEYRRWVDGHPDLDDEANALLRARGAALSAKNHAEADEIHAKLQDRGILVRDRANTQQYRHR